MQKVIDVMIVVMYILFSLLSLSLTIYAGWSVIQSHNATAMTSAAIALVSFALSVYIAKAFEV